MIPLHFVKESERKPQNITLKIGLRDLPESLKLFILIAGIFDLARFNYMFFVLRAQQAFTGKLSIGVPILLYVLFNIFYAAFAVPFGVLSDRIGRGRIIVLGYILFSLTCLGFAFFNSLPAFVILFALYGVMHAIIDGNQRAFVSDLSPDRLKATALGTFHTVIGLVELPASLIAGFLWQYISPGAAFIYGSVVGIIPVVLLIAFRSHFEVPGELNKKF